MEPWTVVCVLRSGGIYGPEHVAWLRRQVAWQVKGDYVFRCLTDVPGVPDSIPMVDAWPNWWAKVGLFRPGLFTGPVMYLDLDVVLCNRIDLAAIDLAPGVVHAPADWWRPGERQGSVMLWRADAGRAVYEPFAANPAGAIAITPHGDQQWMSQHAVTADSPVVCRSWKAHQGSSFSGHVCVFHGKPKPWDIDHPRVPQLRVPDIRSRWLVDLIRQRGYRVAVELGVGSGQTTTLLGLRCPQTTIYGVDRWDGNYPKSVTAYNLRGWGVVRQQYYNATAQYGNIKTLEMDTVAAAGHVPGPVDVLFVDAEHTYPAVMRECAAWLPKMSPGGVVAGHDIHVGEVRKAVEELFPGRWHETADKVWWVEV
jgi:predicted O-methyltransferase YrrM